MKAKGESEKAGVVNSPIPGFCQGKREILRAGNGKTYPLLPRRRPGQNICQKKFPNYLDWKYCIEKPPNENTKRHLRGFLIFSSKRQSPNSKEPHSWKISQIMTAIIYRDRGRVN